MLIVRVYLQRLTIIMINYAAAIGYVCDNCRHSLTSMNNRYDVALNAITEEVAILRAELCSL